MKKIILTLSIIFSFVLSYSQDTIRLKHKSYVTVFSKSKKYPVLVEWWVTKKKVTCTSPIPRTDNFGPDPLLPKETDLLLNYKGSGYDRGHMSPAADNQCEGIAPMNECFYFSNMAPQLHSLNAGDWKSLETLTREEAKTQDSIHIWAGNIGSVMKINNLTIPEYCWKVVYYPKTKKYVAYLFKNNSSKPDGIENNKVPLSQITKLTGFKF